MNSIPAASTHILIAEDSPTQAQRLKYILEQKGYDVEVTTHGRQALDAARRRKPVLLISDVVMPEMNGYELCKSIKSDAALGDVPVILVTTLSDAQDVIQGLECRADHFILKPYDERHLLGRVQHVLLNRDMGNADQPGMGLEIFFNGKKHFITADRLQILNLLLSTYEAAMQRNRELASTQDTLRETNSELQELTRELEDRVLRRTQELEESNEALRASQQRFQTLAESLPQLIWTATPDGRCDYLNRRWEEYCGEAVGELQGYRWMMHLHPDDRDEVRSEWARTILSGQSFDREFRLAASDGTYRWFKSRAIPLREPGKGIVKWFGANTDFEDIKRYEQTLHIQLERRDLLNGIIRAIAQRQDLRSIFQVLVRRLEDHLPVDFGCVGIYDSEHRALLQSGSGSKNQKLASLLRDASPETLGIGDDGLTRCLTGETVYATDIGTSDSPFLRQLAAQGLNSVVGSPLMVDAQLFGILVVARRDLHGFSTDEQDFLRELSDHVGLAAHQARLNEALQNAYDDLRRTQQAVMQQERLRALGQMASGVAHDINNAISPITLYADALLEAEQDLSEQGRKYLTTIRRAIGDVAKTVARMREFYRSREPEEALGVVKLNELVQQAVELTHAKWSDQPQRRGLMIELATDLENELPLIRGSEHELRDALTNLIFNAVDAMPEGGNITLRTRFRKPEAGDSGQVSVAVEDSGLGMDETTRRKCLEPFFTTKGERGTGLGLAMVYGMAQRHGADMEIDSEVGKGTTVRLVFPAAVATSAMAADSAPVQVEARPLRVLLVDDDELVLESMFLILRNEGHEVAVAAGGQAGIDEFLAAENRGQPYDVVFSDLGMPYVDGRKVAEKIRAASSRVWIVLLTGWGQRMEAENDRPAQVDHILSKPPKLADLRRVMGMCSARRDSSSPG